MRSLVESILAASLRIARSLYDALFGRTPTAREVRRARVLGRRAVLTIWRLRRAYEAAAGDGHALDALHELAQVLPSGPELRRAVTAWTVLVEAVVQEAEKRYGSEKGRGAFKAQQVRSVFVRLLIDQKFPTSNVPVFLEPVIVEELVAFWVDSMVLVLNRHELWDDPPLVGVRLGFWLRIVHTIRQLWQWFWQLPVMVAFSNWLRTITRKLVLLENPLAPAVEQALEQVRRDGLLDVDDATRRMRELVDWIRRHRRRLVALVEIISMAIEEAEAFERMSGPAKKDYATALIKAFLEEFDLAPPEGSLAAVVIDYVIDYGIDSLVYVYHKRTAFPAHRRAAA